MELRNAMLFDLESSKRRIGDSYSTSSKYGKAIHILWVVKFGILGFTSIFHVFLCIATVGS